MLSRADVLSDLPCPGKVDSVSGGRHAADLGNQADQASCRHVSPPQSFRWRFLYDDKWCGLADANKRHSKRPLFGYVLVSDNESWITGGRAFGYGHRGSTGVMTEWQEFVKNARRYGITDPELVSWAVSR